MLFSGIAKAKRVGLRKRNTKAPVIAASMRNANAISAHRSTVNAHAQAQTWVIFKRTAQLDRAANRRFGTGVKDQSHAVTSGNLNQAIGCLSFLKLLR